MTGSTPLAFDLPAVRTKKLTVDFNGGNQSSDAGMLLLRGAEKKTGVIARLAAAFRDRRDPARIRHRLGEIIEGRVFGICCGYEDGIDYTVSDYKDHTASVQPSKLGAMVQGLALRHLFPFIGEDRRP